MQYREAAIGRAARARTPSRRTQRRHQEQRRRSQQRAKGSASPRGMSVAAESRGSPTRDRVPAYGPPPRARGAGNLSSCPLPQSASERKSNGAPVVRALNHSSIRPMGTSTPIPEAISGTISCRFAGTARQRSHAAIGSVPGPASTGMQRSKTESEPAHQGEE